MLAKIEIRMNYLMFKRSREPLTHLESEELDQYFIFEETGEKLIVDNKLENIDTAGRI